MRYIHLPDCDSLFGRVTDVQLRPLPHHEVFMQIAAKLVILWVEPAMDEAHRGGLPHTRKLLAFGNRVPFEVAITVN